MIDIINDGAFDVKKHKVSIVYGVIAAYTLLCIILIGILCAYHFKLICKATTSVEEIRGDFNHLGQNPNSSGRKCHDCCHMYCLNKRKIRSKLNKSLQDIQALRDAETLDEMTEEQRKIAQEEQVLDITVDE